MDSLRPKEVYEQICNEIVLQGPESISDINKLNVARLHQNESEILRKNLEYLIKLRK